MYGSNNLNYEQNSNLTHLSSQTDVKTMPIRIEKLKMVFSVVIANHITVKLFTEGKYYFE